MTSDLHIDSRVTDDGSRFGRVEVLLTDDNGAEGADVTDIQVRWDDGAVEWTTPDALVVCGPKPGACATGPRRGE